jgi:DNA-binding SARP family transcriptional activator
MTKEIAISPSQRVGFFVLGPLEAHVAGQPVDIGPIQEQRLLVGLLSVNEMPVSRYRLMEWVWDEPQPEGAAQAFYKLVYNLRKRLDKLGLKDHLTTNNGNYRLGVPAAWVDVHRFHDLTRRAGEIAAAGARQQATDLLREALTLHRAEPLAGLPGHRIDTYRLSLNEERRSAELALNEMAIQLGHHSQQLPQLARLHSERPGDEWVGWLLMHALYRAGRQQDAHLVYHELRGHLDGDAVDSLQALSDLLERMLRRDNDLQRPEAVVFPVGRPAMPSSRPASRPPTPHNSTPPDGDRDGDRQEAHDAAGEPAPSRGTAGTSARPRRDADVVNEFYDKVELDGGSVIGIMNVRH